MKNFIVLAASALAFGCLTSGSSFAASATATATITTAIAIGAGSDLMFGLIVPAASLTTVTIDPTVSGYSSRTGSAAFLIGAGGAGPSSFVVTGSDALTYTITLPANGIVTLEGPGNGMPVYGFTSSPSGIGALTSGAQTLTVGATVDVGAGQSTGAYSGTYAVTVAYN
jgi:hypothetical protein